MMFFYKPAIQSRDGFSEPHRKNIQFPWNLLIRLTILWFALFFLFILGSAQIDSWKGSFIKKDGIVVVQNPVQPVFKGDIIRLDEELSIPDTDGNHYILTRPSNITSNESGYIFVSDQEENDIKVFTREGRFFRKIGRKGQGPGEFDGIGELFFIGTNLAVYDSGNRRITLFSQNGEFYRSISSAALRIDDIQSDSKGNLYALVRYPSKKTMNFEIFRLESDLNEKGRFAKTFMPIEMTMAFFKAGPSFCITPDDRVIFGLPDDRYEFDIYGNDGLLERRIQKKHIPEIIPEKEIAPVSDKIPPGLKWYIPKIYSPYQMIQGTLNDHIIILRRYYLVEKRFIFDVFSPDGQFMAAFTLYNLDRGKCFMQKDKLYTIEESSDGFPVIKRYKVTFMF